MARPTKYNAEMQEKAEAYLSGGFDDLGHVVPSQVGLANFLDVDRTTLIDWGKKHPEFSYTLAKIDNQQHILALAGGLKGNFNAAITKLLLHNHGYSDRQAKEISGPGGSAIGLTVEFIE